MAISFSRPDPSSPSAVGAASFPVARRGYDQGEVRDFLRMVAAELARLHMSKGSLVIGLSVVTDVAGRWGLGYLLGNFLAIDKVVFYGHPVAAVAATSWHIAEDALDLIDVDYEVIPHVTSLALASQPGAPLVWDDCENNICFETVNYRPRLLSGSAMRLLNGYFLPSFTLPMPSKCLVVLNIQLPSRVV